MSWKDNCPRPYYKKYERVPVKNDFGWFEVYKLPADVYAITEPNHCQEINSYLIMGKDKAVLFDTGEGFFNIKVLAEELYGGEIIVVNSHSHFDHIGCNYLFDTVLAFDDSQSRYTASAGAPNSLFADQLGEDLFLYGYPEGFDPKSFSIPPYKFSPVKDGDRIDLGDRMLEVIHTPGHSSDCIMLLDQANGILFTGDSFYLAALYAHFNCREFGVSDLNDYAASLEKTAALGDAVRMLYCSHNEFIAPACKLQEAALALRQISGGSIKDGESVDMQHVYLEDGSNLKEYFFNGFSIVCKA
jgi:glyoxylase-like metal-dependent hydrolase (beta-lactamase superfamily II)